MTVYGFLDFAAEIQGISGGDRKRQSPRGRSVLLGVGCTRLDTLSKVTSTMLLCAIHYP